MKRFFLLTFLVITQLTVTSCSKNTDAEMQDFVGSYNKSMAMVLASTPNMKHSYAEVAGLRKIKIVFELTVQNDPAQKAVFEQVFPGMLANMFHESEPKALIEQGVTFEVVVTASDNTVLTSTTYDKASLATMEKQSAKEIDNPINPSGTRTGNKVLSPELQQGLNMLKKTLPIVNKEEGTSITDIDINDTMELEYHVVVDEQFAGMVASPEAMALLKENAMRSPNFGTILRSLSPYGIKSMRFSYFDKKDKKLGDFTISSKDLHP